MDRSTRLTYGLALVAFLTTGPVRGDDPAKKPNEPVDAAPAQPTPEHQRLEKDAGVWDAVATFFGPNGEENSKGVETNRMLGGFWLVSEFKGEFFGAPFEGRSQLGYDPIKKKYVGTWIDCSFRNSMYVR